MKLRSRTEVSAGGFVYKREGGKMLWLLCKHSGYHKWVFPKGRVEQGENIEDTALREVQEETGIRAKVVKPFPNPEKYVYTMNGERVFKTVHYFIMEYVSGDIADHDWEMEDAIWATSEEVLGKLAFAQAKRVFAQAVRMVEKD